MKGVTLVSSVKLIFWSLPIALPRYALFAQNKFFGRSANMLQIKRVIHAANARFSEWMKKKYRNLSFGPGFEGEQWVSRLLKMQEYLFTVLPETSPRATACMGVSVPGRR